VSDPKYDVNKDVVDRRLVDEKEISVEQSTEEPKVVGVDHLELLSK